MASYRLNEQAGSSSSIPLRVSGARQLFVDDYLISSTDLKRVFGKAKPFEGNPVLRPETEAEMNMGECPLACPFNDGVWLDPSDGLFKIWYHAGWFHGTALAVSRDGVVWERPRLKAVPGTNLVLPLKDGVLRDGSLVWLDLNAAKEEERFKMFLYERWRGGEGGSVFSSPDGVSWRLRGKTGPCGDNTSFYFDPFRQKWVYSVRGGMEGFGRVRLRLEREDFFDCQWSEGEPAPWLACDEFDAPDPAIGFRPQLYDFNAAPYESVMLGLMAIMKGPENDVCEAKGIPKTNDLELAFSRDGVNWARPPASSEAFLSCSRAPGRWDCAYLHAAGGLFVRLENELRFYYSGFSGESPKLCGSQRGSYFSSNAMYAGGSTGFATLRLDGFASMRAAEKGGTLLTRKLLASPGPGALHVNCASPKGELRVEALGPEGSPVPGCELESSVPFQGDSTDAVMRWREREALPADGETPFQLRFHLRGGSLYSFWLA